MVNISLCIFYFKYVLYIMQSLNSVFGNLKYIRMFFIVMHLKFVTKDGVFIRSKSFPFLPADGNCQC